MRAGILIIACVSLAAQAATFYARQGASGAADGANWTDAYTTPSAAYAAAARGDTIYVADGSYAGFTYAKAASGTTVITLKKATVADHGTETGWNNSYGDGQWTNTSSSSVNTEYHVIDGQTGGGPGSWTNGFGLKVEVTGVSSGAGFFINGDNNTIRHVEIKGNGGDGDGTGTANDMLWIGADSFTGSYLYLYDAGRCIIFSNQNNTNCVIEYMWSGYHESTVGQHSEVMSLWGTGAGAVNWTIRWSIITHSEGTGGILFDGDDLKVYGCVFAPLNGGSLGGGNGLIGTWTADSVTNLKVYNNSFIDHGANVLGILEATDSGEFRNNVVYSGNAANNSSGLQRVTHTHNHYVDITDGPVTEATQTTGTGDPFTDWVNVDFGLIANTTAGTDLGSPYNVDMLGNTRTTWTRGAIEFDAGEAPPVTAFSGNATFSGAFSITQ